MEPLQSGADAPETAPDVANDPGVQEAAEVLESLVGSQGGGAQRETPEPAPEPAQQPSRVNGRATDYQTFQRNQRGYVQRMQETRQRAAGAVRESERYAAFVQNQNRINQDLVNLLRQQQPEKAPEIPDPLDPRFGPWLQQQLASGIDQRLSPVLQHFEQQRLQAEQHQERQAEEEYRQAFTNDFAERYTEYGRLYEEAAGPLAHGYHDRLETMRSLMAQPWIAHGESPQEAQRRVDAQIFLIGNEAEQRGFNPVAAIDNFLTAQAAAFGLYPDSGEESYQPPAPVYQRPQTETGRLAQVQQRSRPAASQRPQVAERSTSRRSELEALVAVGETDVRKLQRAALTDSNGNRGLAAIALNRIQF